MSGHIEERDYTLVKNPRKMNLTDVVIYGHGVGIGGSFSIKNEIDMDLWFYVEDKNGLKFNSGEQEANNSILALSSKKLRPTAIYESGCGSLVPNYELESATGSHYAKYVQSSIEGPRYSDFERWMATSPPDCFFDVACINNIYITISPTRFKDVIFSLRRRGYKRFHSFFCRVEKGNKKPTVFPPQAADGGSTTFHKRPPLPWQR